MGAPLEDADRLGVWANLIQGQFDPIKIATMLPELERAAEEFGDYTQELLRARHDDPGDDLISELIAAEEEGDRLSDEECAMLVSAVLVGGVDTTQAQLAHGLRLFADHPDQWRLLAEDPGLAPAAAEEVLRYEPITPFTARIALEDIEYRDVTFPEGTLARRLQRHRQPRPRRVRGAGHASTSPPIAAAPSRSRSAPGPHFCLGANLARAELQEAFAFLAPRMPGLALDGEPDYDTPIGIYALNELPHPLRLRLTCARGAGWPGGCTGR